MKMIQTEMALRQTTEIFYDGTLPVDYSQGPLGVVEIPRKKIHWRDALLMRGYEPLEEEPASEAKPKRQTRRKKVSDADDQE